MRDNERSIPCQALRFFLARRLVKVRRVNTGLLRVFRIVFATYQKVAHAGDHSPHIVLFGEDDEIAILALANEIPQMRECVEEIANGWVVVSLAVIRRQPATGSGGQEGSIGPAVRVN